MIFYHIVVSLTIPWTVKYWCRYATARSWGFFFVSDTTKRTHTSDSQCIQLCAPEIFLVSDTKINTRADWGAGKSSSSLHHLQIWLAALHSKSLVNQVRVATLHHILFCESDLSSYTALLSTGTLSHRPQPICRLSSDIRFWLCYASALLRSTFLCQSLAHRILPSHIRIWYDYPVSQFAPSRDILISYWTVSKSAYSLLSLEITVWCISRHTSMSDLTTSLSIPHVFITYRYLIWLRCCCRTDSHPLISYRQLILLPRTAVVASFRQPFLRCPSRHISISDLTTSKNTYWDSCQPIHLLIGHWCLILPP
jgi:hypothetical protein